MGAAVFVPLAAGMTLFLTGLRVMEFALHRWAGGWLSRALETFTKTPLRGLVSGTVLTAAVQSSTAVTVMTVGLVNAGVLRFPQTLGVILGANVGTCLTTELIGISPDRFAAPLLVAGTALWAASIAAAQARLGRAAYRRVRSAGFAALALVGFAAILYGMNLMTSIVPALESGALFQSFVELASQSALLGVVAGAALTAVVQSSAAVIGLAMGLAEGGAIDVPLGIAVTLGANIGTCSTALLAAFGGSRASRFVAWTHVWLNVAGTVLFYPFIGQLAQWTALLADDPAVRIAHAQTIFNVVCSLVALPVCYLPAVRKMRPDDRP